MKVLDRNWKSFFRAIKECKKDNSKFNGRPRPPRYKLKNGKFILIFASQQVKLKESILCFPKKAGFQLKTRLHDKTDIREIRTIPKGVSYDVEIGYQKEFI